MNIDTHKLKKYEKLYLGFSGGADSTALAHALLTAGIGFEAVHFHHHLREKSADKDADFCRKFCNKHGIPFQKVDLDVLGAKTNKESVESTARLLRQKWWETKSTENSLVLLAHHKDDQRENFLLRALRGSSASGLTGFKEKVTIKNVTYVRPLFHITREQIINYLNDSKVSWQEDESNCDVKFQRNRIRHQVIPSLARAGNLEGLDRTLKNTAQDADFLEKSAQDWLKSTSLTTANFLASHDALKARIIRYFILQNFKLDYYPGHDAVNRLVSECQKQHSECISVNLTQDITVCISAEGEIFSPPVPFDIEWSWREQPNIEINSYRLSLQIDQEPSTLAGEHFCLSDLDDELSLRNWLPGDTMVPFGRKAPKKVKKLLNDKKLSAREKLEVPMLLSKKEIIFIPGVKRAQFGKVNTNDQIAIIHYERI